MSDLDVQLAGAFGELFPSYGYVCETLGCFLDVDAGRIACAGGVILHAGCSGTVGSVDQSSRVGEFD